uniref:dolichyl-phosphate beta-glucosyltransferase n=1 Tax=Sphaeramia orbicularis TaxID=375764 RepID=A0A672YPG6_9TELE
MDFLCEIVQALVALAALGLIVVFIIAHVTAGMVNLTRHEKEKYFLTATGEKEKFPSLHDPYSRELSVVIPAYNEELRMPVMLDEAMGYLENRQKQNPSFTYEVIVVDDGSKDKTTEVAMQYTRKYGADKVRVLTLVKNRGKGGAVRMDNLAISCGSRAHLEKDSVAQRSMFRTFLMYGFHFLVWFFCVRGIKDTQCGFKLFTREAALKTFSSLHVERWAFDVELLYIAQCFEIPIAEVAVNWTEIEGSKLVPFWSWLQMGRDLVFIRLRYITGAWKLQSPQKTD